MEPPSIRQNCWRSKRAGPVCSESVRKWIFPIQKGEEPAELCMLISPRPGRHHGRAKNCWASVNLACRIGLVWETHIRPHRWWCCGRPSSQKSQPPGALPRPLEVRRATVDSVPHTGEPAPQASRRTRIAPCLYSFLYLETAGRLPLSRLTCLPHPIAQFRFAGFEIKRFGLASVCWSFGVSSRAHRHTETIELALPGHEFYVVALDGNPIPRPNKVKVLQLGSAERVDAIVEMKNPGVWILGTPMDEDRNRGMGIVVEYAGRKGKPQWHSPGKSDWDYLLFGESKSAITPDEVIPMEIGKINGGKGGFNIWTINGQPYDHSKPKMVTMRAAAKWKPERLVSAKRFWNLFLSSSDLA